MTVQKIFEEARIATKELVQKMREISKLQKDLWQQVPYLALQADGRTGYSDQYSRAYEQGYWAVRGSARDGYYSIYVNLETGELMNAHDPRQAAQDNYVLDIASNMHELDASHIVKELKADAKNPYSISYHTKDREEREKRITSILQQDNIKKDHYRRAISPKEVYEMNVSAPFLDILG